MSEKTRFSINKNISSDFLKEIMAQLNVEKLEGANFLDENTVRIWWKNAENKLECKLVNYSYVL